MYCKLLVDAYNTLLQVIHPWNRSYMSLLLLYVLTSNSPMEQVCSGPPWLRLPSLWLWVLLVYMVKWGSGIGGFGTGGMGLGSRFGVWSVECGYFGWYRWSLPPGLRCPKCCKILGPWGRSLATFGGFLGGVGGVLDPPQNLTASTYTTEYTDPSATTF